MPTILDTLISFHKISELVIQREVINHSPVYRTSFF